MAHSEDLPKRTCESCGMIATKVVYDQDRLIGYFCSRCAETRVRIINNREPVEYTYKSKRKNNIND